MNLRKLFGRMMRESASYDSVVVSAISRIRRKHCKHEFKLSRLTNEVFSIESKRFVLIAITNNFVAPYNGLVSLANAYKSTSSLNTNPSTLASSDKSAFDPIAELSFLSWTDSPVPTSLREMFDVFIDSSEVGMRKPESGIFDLALKEGGKLFNGERLKADECVMIDDLRMNLKTARELGMHTVRKSPPAAQSTCVSL